VLERPELVGREVELAAARAWVGGLADGPTALVVRGEAGIGKTSIWSAAAELARAAGALILSTRPAEAEMPLGYAGLGDLLETVASDVLPELPAFLAAHLEAALLLASPPESEDRLAVSRATLGVVRALAARGPVVVAIDDAQWLDPASARALAFTARRLSGEPVGFVLSLRSGAADPLDCAAVFGDQAVGVEVNGLSLGATSHLVRTRVDAQTPRRVVQLIHERSQGNPFYALQLARHATEDDLPESLRDVVERRLAAADQVCRPALEQAAVRGPAPTDTFADAGALRAALETGLLVEDGGEVRFAHPLLAAGAYARTSRTRRRELHLQAAGTSRGDEEQARHLALALDEPDAAAAAALDAAARTAGARGAPDAAAELAGHAARLTPPTDPAARLARLSDEVDHLVRAGNETKAGTVAAEVLAGDPRGAVRVRALVHSALLARDPATAVARLEEATREETGDPLLTAGTLAQLAWQRGAWFGDVDAAYPEAVRAVALAAAAGDPGTLVHALTTAGMMGTVLGATGADDYFDRALEVLDRSPDAWADRSPRIAYGHVLWWRGDWAAAQPLLREDRAEAERRGDDGLVMRLDIFEADFETRRGGWDRAEQLLATALGDARDYWRIMALVQRAFLRARRGDPAALEDATEIAASPMARGDVVIAAYAQHALGLLAVARGDRDTAADLLLHLPATIDKAGVRALEIAAVIPETVLALVDAGRGAEAAPLIAALESRRPQFGAWGLAAIDLCHGLVQSGSDGSEAGLARIESGRRGFEELDAPWELGLSLLAEGSVLRRLGRRSAAAAALERSAAVLDVLGARPARDRALAGLDRARPRPGAGSAPTAAERRVAALVVSGMTNKQVAAQLFTSVATVEAHLTRLYSKVGVRSRTRLTRLVADGALDVDG
jgi:DNA-binding CsgD family transcriptional regulator/tetratricopeptide (TPR) repeat protein